MTLTLTHKASTALVCILLGQITTLNGGNLFSMPNVPSLQKSLQQVQEEEAARVAYALYEQEKKAAADKRIQERRLQGLPDQTEEAKKEEKDREWLYLQWKREGGRREPCCDGSTVTS